MRERHTMRVVIDEGSVYFLIKCPYDVTDEARPCWPHDVDAEDPTPLPAPQDICTYDSWVDNLAPSEIHAGEWEGEFAIDWEWDDSPRVHLLGPIGEVS